MLVVVVVVVAMFQKGERVGTIQTTLGRAPSKEHNVSQRIGLANMDDVENGETYIISVSGYGPLEIDEFELEVTIHESQKAFSMPAKEIKDNGLRPGHCISIQIFEKVEQPVISDNAAIIDRVNVNKDSHRMGNIDNKLYSKKVCSYIGNDESSEVKFRNTKNGKEEMGEVKQYPKPTEFSFPSVVRRGINPSPGDLIEIIAPKNQENHTEDEDKDVEELIREMHGMMMEMYNDCMESQDD